MEQYPKFKLCAEQVSLLRLPDGGASAALSSGALPQPPMAPSRAATPRGGASLGAAAGSGYDSDAASVLGGQPAGATLQTGYESEARLFWLQQLCRMHRPHACLSQCVCFFCLVKRASGGASLCFACSGHSRCFRQVPQGCMLAVSMTPLAKQHDL